MDFTAHCIELIEKEHAGIISIEEVVRSISKYNLGEGFCEKYVGLTFPFAAPSSHHSSTLY